MQIGGIEDFTLSDYPGKIATIVFTKGCNLMCPFCHNWQLIENDKKNYISEEDFLLKISKRTHIIDGIVICGGEPTIHKDLDSFILKIKELNLSVKLDTNGTKPEVLEDLIERNLLDFIAMDVKAPEYKYNILSGTKVNYNNIKRSIDIISNSNVPHLFRTTYVKKLLSKEDIENIKKIIPENSNYILQKFIPENAACKSLK